METPTPASMPAHRRDPLVLTTRKVEYRLTTEHSLLCTCPKHGKRKHYGRPMLVTVKSRVVVETIHGDI